MKQSDRLLDPQSGIPLYLQLQRIIEDEIKAGHLETGAQAPSENELVLHYGVSRSTVRQAYEKLVASGYLVKIRGRGTFVSHNWGAPEEFYGNQKTIAFLMRDAAGGVQPALIQSVSTMAFHAGYSVTVNNTGNSLERALAYVNRIAEQKACGVIFRPLALSPFDEVNYRICEELQRCHLPFVFLDIPVENVAAVCIRSDNVAGGRLVGKHLYSLGHQTVLIVSNVENPSARDRKAGFEEVYGHPVHFIHYFDEIEGDFERKIKKYLHGGNRPTAIFAIHDLVARKVMMYLTHHGFRLPEEMSVVGFDNLDFCELLNPPLTTVHQHLEKMGNRAVKELIKVIKKPGAQSKDILLPVELIRRRSAEPRKVLNP